MMSVFDISVDSVTTLDTGKPSIHLESQLDSPKIRTYYLTTTFIYSSVLRTVAITGM